MLIKAKTENDKMNGHLSVNHKENNHTYWIFVYDKSGEHEQDSQSKIEKTKSSRVKKYTGLMPNESEVKKML